MSAEHESSRDSRLQEVLVAYLEAVESGASSPEEWLARHPEFAAELSEFMANRGELDRLAAPLRQAADAARADAALAETVDSGPVKTADATPLPGSLPRPFGDYELLEEVARGGMGVVYKARQVSL